MMLRMMQVTSDQMANLYYRMLTARPEEEEEEAPTRSDAPSENTAPETVEHRFAREALAFCLSKCGRDSPMLAPRRASS
jgi:hypothetical protein